MRNRATDRVKARARYRKLVKLKTCVHCGKAPAKTDRTMCQTCLDKGAKYNAIRIKKRNKISAFLGKCSVCHDRDVMPRRKWCGVCAERRTEQKRRLFLKRKAAGSCTECGKERDTENRTHCFKCREYRRLQSLARRQKFQVAA